MFSKSTRNMIGQATISTFLLIAGNAMAQQTFAVPQNAEFPITTKSPEARRLIDNALNLYLDQVEQAKSIVVLHQAIKADPDSAMAHELLAQISLDAAEQVSEQEKAFAIRAHATQSEQTLIEWYQDASDEKLIPAITKMND